ncbi:hypothetical protein BC629DRAFT_1550445 [Irpex lacteus]|nr:hypothetical protein BC629DRAFT_1550445 [Irpex lacteus]
MLKNFGDIVDDLKTDMDERPAEAPNSLYSPITTIHALKIMCLAIHLVRAPSVSRHFDKWRKLFASLTNLVYHTMGPTRIQNSTDLPPKNRGPADAPDTVTRPLIELCRFARLSQNEALPQLALACLKRIQTRDLKTAFPRLKGRKDTYEDWLVEFKETEALFTDDSVEMLGVVYLASQPSDTRREAIEPFFRLKKLGTLDKVQDFLRLMDDGKPWNEAKLDSPLPIHSECTTSVDATLDTKDYSKLFPSLATTSNVFASVGNTVVGKAGEIR